MAAKTATICAGVQANGTGDCVAFYNGLEKKGYTGVAYGNKGTPQQRPISTMPGSVPYYTGAATAAKKTLHSIVYKVIAGSA